MVKAMVGGCCVCSDERGWDENPLVYCDGHGCNVAVHQACYGIVQVPKGPWFCRKCESQERIARVKCELCPSKSGALKRTDTGGWAHVVCALYIPEVRFGNVTTMEPIILASVPHERYIKMCYICEERGKESKTAHGGCMNCNKQGCKQTFHVTCAQSCGFLCEENDGQSGPTVKYVGYCQFHWNKRNKGLLNIKTPEKDKLKMKLEKEKEREKEKDKKPKPRTSSESAAVPSTATPGPKPDDSSKPSSSTSSSGTTATTAFVSQTVAPIAVGTPKPRGRKPSTVKTLLSTSSISEIKAEKETAEAQEVISSTPGSSVTVVPPVSVVSSSVATPTSSSPSVTTVKSDSSFTPIPSSALNTLDQGSAKNISSLSQSVGQPTPTPPPVSVPMPKTTTQAKPAAKATVVKKTQNQPKQLPAASRKRPSTKAENEPKRKVGRPPLKQKASESKSKARSASTSKPPKSKPQGKPKEVLSPKIVSSSPVTSSLNYSGYPMSSTSNMSYSSPGPVLVHNSMPPSMPASSSHGTSPHVIPQPRFAGQLENGYSSQDQANQRPTTNGPLQLPNSLEQLLEYQWEQGAQFLMQQASQYDVASLMSSLHQLKADNSRLENRLDSLVSRRSQLLQVSSRLSASMSCTPTNTSTTSTDSTNKDPAGTKVTSSAATQCVPTASARLMAVASSSQTSKPAGNFSEKTATLKAETVLSPSSVPKIIRTLPSSTNGTPMGSKSITGKARVDKSPPVKIPVSLTTTHGIGGTLTMVPTTPKLVTQKPINLQPNQIKITMVQPHVQQGMSDKDKQKITATAAPIAILPTTSHSNQLLQKQQFQLIQTQNKQPQIVQNKNNKQALILPHQTVTSQAFTAQPFSQQQLVLLMQQQQQQHFQQQLQRQGQSALYRQDQPGQNQLVSAASQAQCKGNAPVHSQKFVSNALPLGYQGSYLTFNEALNLQGQHIDVSKATAFTTLPLVQLDKTKGMDHTDKNGTAPVLDRTSKNS